MSYIAVDTFGDEYIYQFKPIVKFLYIKGI